MKAEYINHMGTDLTVANAARVSFDKESMWDEEDGQRSIFRLSDRDIKLIRYLAKHKHWTPFAHPHVTFRITAPIFVARQAFKHKVGFVENEISRRYVSDAPTFYVPDVWRTKPDNAKQGSGDGEVVELTFVTRDGENTYTSVQSIDQAVRDLYDHAEQLYNAMIESNVAPEQARMVLPQAMYTSWYWTGSLAAWGRFFAQRTDAHAQKEIELLARDVGPVMENLFPVSWKELTSE